MANVDHIKTTLITSLPDLLSAGNNDAICGWLRIVCYLHSQQLLVGQVRPPVDRSG